MQHFLPFLLLLNTTLAFSSDRPKWTTRQPESDSTYKYYVGRSSPAATEAEAFKLATKNAYENAIRENYGVLTEINSSEFENETEFRVIRHSQESSQKVIISEFEQIDSYVEKNSNQISAWTLYRYKKAAISLELTRLSRSPSSESEYSLVGSDDIGFNTELEIVTIPAGADLFIDDIRWGRTPVRLKGSLEPGKHVLELKHPQYADLKQDFLVLSKKPLKITKTLEPATGKIIITTDPSGAKVYLNEKYIGESPTQEITVLAAKPNLLSITHPDTESIRQLVTVDKDASRTIDLTLTLKPSYIKITGLVLDLTISLDHTTLSLDQIRNKISVPQGRHLITIEKTGYDNIEKDVWTNPGETIVLQIPELEKTKDHLPQTTYASTYWSDDDFTSTATHQSAFITSFNFSLNTQTSEIKGAQGYLGLGISFEKRFWRYFGLKGEGSYDMGTGQSSSSNESVTYEHDQQGTSALWGVVLYFSDDRSPAYISYETGGLKYTISPTTSSDTEKDITVSQSRTAFSIGQVDYDKNFYISLSLYTNSLPNGQTYSSMGLNLGILTW